MESKKEKLAQQQNGHVVMKALREMDKLPTLLNLTRYIASKYDADEIEIKEPIKKVLDTAITIGILTRQGGKYYLYGDEPETDNANEVVDAVRRGRRRRKSSSSRSRKSSMAGKKGDETKSRSRSRRRRRRSKSM